MSKYALLCYNSINIGDEIQAIAQTRFLPKIDAHAYREQIKNFAHFSQEKFKLIMNAWWMWSPKNFPPSNYIDPLLISMYIQKEIRDVFLTKDTREFLLKYGPVGCRDVDTANWLNENEIPAYFSGCLTLTLQRSNKSSRKDYILCVDQKPEVLEYIRKKTNRPVYNVSKNISVCYSHQERMELAKVILRLFNDAHCVVSQNVHTCLPTLALETPVLRVITNGNDEAVRWSGMENFVHSVHIKDLLADNYDYDFSTPPLNPSEHMQYREEMIKKCQEFTGFNNEKSLICEWQEPLVNMFNIDKHNKIKMKKALYHCDIKDLRQALCDRENGYGKQNIIGDVPDLQLYRP